MRMHFDFRYFSKSMIAALIMLLSVSLCLPVLAKSLRKDFTVLQDLQSTGLEFFINEKDLEHDLEKGNLDLKLYFDARALLKEKTYPQNIKLEIYTIENGKKSFISILNRTVKNKKAARSIFFAVDLDRVHSSTELFFDVYDSHGVLHSTFSKAVSLASSTQQTNLDSVPDFACDDNDGECLLEYMLRHVTFSANFDNSLRTEVYKNDKGRYFVNIPVKKGRLLKDKVNGFKIKSEGNSNTVQGTTTGSYPLLDDGLEQATMFWNKIREAMEISFEDSDKDFAFKKDGSLQLSTNVDNGFINIAPGSTEKAPIVFSQGELMTQAVEGALEYDGKDLYFTNGVERFILGQQGPPGPAGPIGPAGPSGGGGGGSSTGVAGAVQFSDGTGGFNSNSANFFWDSGNTRLGLGTTSPDQLLTVNGGIGFWPSGTNYLVATNDNDLYLNSAHFHAQWGIWARSSSRLMGFDGTTTTMNLYTNGTSRATLDSNGDFGIGFSDPIHKLSVNGSLQMVDGSQANGYVMVSDINGVASWQNLTTALNGTSLNASGAAGAIQFSGGSGAFNSNDSEFVWDNNNGRLAVNKPAAAYNLDVNGHFLFTASTGHEFYTQSTASDYYLRLRNGVGTSHLHIGSDNNSSTSLYAHNGPVNIQPGSYHENNQYQFRNYGLYVQSYNVNEGDADSPTYYIDHGLDDATAGVTKSYYNLGTYYQDTKRPAMQVRTDATGNNSYVGISNHDDFVPQARLHVNGSVLVSDANLTLDNGDLQASNFNASSIDNANHIYITVPAFGGAVGDAYEFISFTRNSGAHNFLMSVNASISGYAVGKTYLVSAQWNQSPSYTRLMPLSSTGDYTAAHDFDVDIMVSTTTVTLRLRKVAGTIVGTHGIHIDYLGMPDATITELSNSSSGVSAPTDIFSSNPLTQLEDKVGIDVANPAYTLDVNGTAQFHGTNYDVRIQDAGASGHSITSSSSGAHIMFLPSNRTYFYQEATFNVGQVPTRDLLVYGGTNTDFFVADVGTERLGLGIAAPETPLHVQVNGENGNFIKLEADDKDVVVLSGESGGTNHQWGQMTFYGSTNIGGSRGIGGVIKADSANDIYQADDAVMVFDSSVSGGAVSTGNLYTWNENDSSHMVMDADGQLGLGLAVPARKLHISDVMRLEPRSAAPASPALGDIYVDSDTNELCFYDGTSWTGLKSGGACI